MDLIYDKDGVDIVIAPAGEDDGVVTNLDFNFPALHLHKLDWRNRHWDLHMVHRGVLIGKSKFSAYQFFADGVERRTISLEHIEVFPEHRHQNRSEAIAQFVIDTVERECNRDWNPVLGKPVLFIESRNLRLVPEHERHGALDFLKKIAERVLGQRDSRQVTPDSDLTVCIVGDDISMQLIHGHLVRSAQASHCDPRKDGVDEK